MVFPFILGQGSPSLNLQLEGAPNFVETYKKNDIFELLKLIRALCCKHNQNDDKVYVVMNSIRALFINFKKSDMCNDDYLKEFRHEWQPYKIKMSIFWT